MKKYWVNDTAQTSGEHEVHEQDCYWLGQARSTTYLGEHAHCSTAVAAAKRIYWNSNGCKTCSPACHTG